MFERLTDRARKVMTLANQEAQRMNHDYIDTEHILVGLAVEGSGVAANALKIVGVDSQKIRQQVAILVKPGLEHNLEQGSLPESARVQKVSELAVEESRKLNHRYVGTEHLLLALVREGEGVAAQVLRNLGLNLIQFRQDILSLLGAEIEMPQAVPSMHLTPDRLIRVGIVGVSGYGGGEVLRLCASHPAFDIAYVAGEGSAGQQLSDRFPGIAKVGRLIIQKWDPANLPPLHVLFASLPTGESKTALANLDPKLKIIDIGGDHRYAGGWTYGLADIWPDKILGCNRIANPGCYPAASLTAIAPLLDAGLIDLNAPIIIDAKSGVSGAGRGGGDSKFSYAEVNEDTSAYGLLKHAHLPEIKQTLKALSPGITDQITFTPHLIPMTRGILATCYLQGDATTEQCMAAARKFYADRPFVKVTDQPPHTKWATGSNMVFLHYATSGKGSPIIALAAIDNLGKGAAGQAVQNANLMLGLPETTGLQSSPLWP